MTRKFVGGLLLAALATLPACAARQTLVDVPVVSVQEVKVPVPVPCAALGQLGPEPEYVDTAVALVAAPDVFEQAKLLMAARELRIQRLKEYQAAREVCQ